MKNYPFSICLILLLLSSQNKLLAQVVDTSRYQIKLAQYQFDPLQQTAQFPRDQLPPDSILSGPQFRLIQFAQPLDRKQYQYLKSVIGLRLDHSVRGQAYVERLSERQIKQLRAQDLLRWEGPYLPAYKLAPNIGQFKYETTERQNMGGLLLTAVLAGDCDPQGCINFLKAQGARDIELQDLRKAGFGYRVVFVLPNTSTLQQLASRPEVFRIFEVPEDDMDNTSTAGTIQSGTPGTTPVWNAGIQGQGQIIHVKDTELDSAHCFFRDVPNIPGINHRKLVGFRGSDAGSGHGTYVAGIAAGDDFNNPNGAGTDPGMAYAARITFSPRSTSSFLSDLIAAQGDGAFVHTNSWHNSAWRFSGTAQYDQTAFDADNFLWFNEDHIILGSAGNNGEELGAPGTAKNAICVGAAQSDPNEVNFADGNSAPTPDARRKPDMFAVGCNINSAMIATACGTGPRNTCATSYSTPAMAGAITLVRQYYQDGFYPSGTRFPSHGFTPTGALLKATLLNSTVDMTGVTGYPSNQEGWGVILMDNALFFEGDARNTRVWDVRHANGLFNGETHTYAVNIASNAQSLKISLAYTDAPGTVDSDANVLTNDLDLVVTAPDGTSVYQGNVFASLQSATGGSADNNNNVEMILRNVPQTGVYTISVIGTSVTVGQPGQGYALVASGDFVDPPIPSGEQNTLVVRLFESGGFAADFTSVTDRINAANTYITEVSYDQTSINPIYFPTDGSIELDLSYNQYYLPNQNPLIEMTEEVVQKIIALDPSVFNRGNADPSDDIDRLVLVINSATFTQEWATTGPWPYDLPTGLDRPISVSVNAIQNEAQLFSHNLCNQLGIWDLHAHQGVVFDAPHVDGWDLMAKPLGEVGLTAWSKERVDWLTDHGDGIIFIPRPGVGVTTNRTESINFITEPAANNKVIAIGRSPGVASLANELVYFMIEARDNTGGNIDDGVPEQGVIIYRVDETIPQGLGPVRIVDTDLSTPVGENPLQDAALGIGGSISNIFGTGLDISVAAGSGGNDFDVSISYDPPETDNDVRITVGNPAWTSPDIWVDSPQDGYDEIEGRTPLDRGDDPITGEVNRIYVRINNPGPGDAFDFEALVHVSEPYHTVGGAGDFDQFVEKKYFPTMAAGATELFYVNWIPNDDGDPHSCIEVRIPNVFNDLNPNNNVAQQNTREEESTTASPYSAVNYPFELSNPRSYQALFYFLPEGIPQDWTYTISPSKALLNSGERVEAILTLMPSIDAPVCENVDIAVSSWEAVGNTLVPVGGASVQVQLRSRTNIDLTVSDTCNRSRSYYAQRAQSVNAVAISKDKLRCGIVSQGCTDPPQPFTDIVLKYITPDGQPFYKTVTTDAFGCFSDIFETVEGGLWEVEATYPGDSCQGSATVGPLTVNLPQAEIVDLDQDGLPDGEEPRDNDSGDGDGNPCVLDPDCDGDGILDGQEDPDCILNPDCDGNGIPDGKDQVRKIRYGLQLGSAHPLANYSNRRDANVHVQFQLAYPINKMTDLQLQLGFHQFTSEPTEVLPHTFWTNASLNAYRRFPIAGGWNSYARFGGGLYRSKGGTNTAGINLGVGFEVPLTLPANVNIGIDLHRLFQQDLNVQWLTLHIGLMLR